MSAPADAEIARIKREELIEAALVVVRDLQLRARGDTSHLTRLRNAIASMREAFPSFLGRTVEGET